MFFFETLMGKFRDRRRNIFGYRGGSSQRRGDPVAIGRRLEKECPKYQEYLEALVSDASKVPPGPVFQSMQDQRKEAAERLNAVSRLVFDLKPLSDGPDGVTDAEAIGVLVQYVRFMQGLAREAQLFQTWPGAESPSRPESPTASSAGSGSSGR